MASGHVEAEACGAERGRDLVGVGPIAAFDGDLQQRPSERDAGEVEAAAVDAASRKGARGNKGNSKDAENDSAKAASEPVEVKVDFEGLDQRIVALPIEPGPYGNLVGGKAGQILYLRSAIPAGGPGSLRVYDLEKREEKTLLPAGVNEFSRSADHAKVLYRTADGWAIAKVTDDVGRRFAFNTAIAAVMELVNELSRDTSGRDARFAAETAVSLIQPYAPHVAEELWQRLGYERLWEQPWPVADPALLEVDTVEVVVQVDGKIRDRLHVSPETPEAELVALARGSERVQEYLDGGEPRRTVVVPGKLVNFVS